MDDNLNKRFQDWRKQKAQKEKNLEDSSEAVLKRLFLVGESIVDLTAGEIDSQKEVDKTKIAIAMMDLANTLIITKKACEDKRFRFYILRSQGLLGLIACLDNLRKVFLNHEMPLEFRYKLIDILEDLFSIFSQEDFEKALENLSFVKGMNALINQMKEI